MTKMKFITGRITLGIAHCAGLIDLIALPLWIGALVGTYALDPQEAGFLLTLFLIGVVVSSVLIAPLFNKLRGKWVACLAYAGASLALFEIVETRDFTRMAISHGLGGLCIGAALSIKDGTVARSENPHKLFAILGTALGTFALVFLSVMPSVMTAQGGSVVFFAFSWMMAIASLFALFAFPEIEKNSESQEENKVTNSSAKFGIWYGVAGLCLMSVIQAMSFSFLEQAGLRQGYAVENINAILAVLGLINLIISVLAGVLQHRIPIQWVLRFGPLTQGILVFLVYAGNDFFTYAVAGSLFVSLMIFTHIFAFGYLAKLEPTGRVLAGTPAMIMTGAAIGPILGGTLVKSVGYEGVGYAAILIAIAAFICFQRLYKLSRHFFTLEYI
jgi:predicted MFS family arabinose efflux permease